MTLKTWQYLDKVNYFEGIIVHVSDGAVSIDLKGRLGHMKIPRRMLITDYEPEVGQSVGLNMSYIEVLSGEVDEEYVKHKNQEDHS